MKVCQKCGNLISDNEVSCQKCGTMVPGNFVSNGNNNVVQQPSSQNKKSNSSNGLKIITVLVILTLAGLSVFLFLQNQSLKKDLEKAQSDKNPAYKLSDNNDTSNKVEINTNEGELNFDIPEGTYPKVSQNHVFFIPEDYAATVLEQSGGLSMMNLTTGGSGWLSYNNASVAKYKENKEQLKQTYVTQGYNIVDMYETTIGEENILVLKVYEDSATLLLFVDGPNGGCFVVTVTNSNNKELYDNQTAEEIVKMISESIRLS